MNANTRIQWFHKKVTEMCYPNAMRLSERFHISHRQAQRDVDHLSKNLGAPLQYSSEHKGYFYTRPYALPVVATTDNDELYPASKGLLEDPSIFAAESGIIQMQLPYSATIELRSKLTALELSNYIIAKRGDRTYVCEFHHVDRFLTALLTADADVKLLEPTWLRERLISAAHRVLRNNEDLEIEEE